MACRRGERFSDTHACVTEPTQPGALNVCKDDQVIVCSQLKAVGSWNGAPFYYYKPCVSSSSHETEAPPGDDGCLAKFFTRTAAIPTWVWAAWPMPTCSGAIVIWTRNIDFSLFCSGVSPSRDQIRELSDDDQEVQVKSTSALEKGATVFFQINNKRVT